MVLPTALSTEARKAWAAAIGNFLGSVSVVMAGSGATSIVQLTEVQWLTIAIWTLAAFGITYNVPNGTAFDPGVLVHFPAEPVFPPPAPAPVDVLAPVDDPAVPNAERGSAI